MLNQVFLSYRQESLEHAWAVSRLGELLRQVARCTEFRAELAAPQSQLRTCTYTRAFAALAEVEDLTALKST